MAVQIREIRKGEEYEVNGKNVYKDSNNNWISREELTEEEFVTFRRHNKLAEDNQRFYGNKKV
ncbi:hypothetical protein [Flavobacterium sp. N2820]|uniref:hypothetical protein n=1 Tax=Flavobacterium sp. N2820 TaxID=2986834 RepID=UPI0022252746|nr:hypothetical protein [Flavobacterium sp. N2820]